MQVNLRRIDERIHKLQEIRRIAEDPEMVAMLLEFIATDDMRTEPVRPEPMPALKGDAVAAPRPDDDDLINQVMKGIDGQGSGLWSRKRA
jgi:hypothetical protein